MNLKQARSLIKLNLTEPYLTKYRISDGVIDVKINHFYTAIAFDTRTIENNYTITADGSQSYLLDPEFMLIKRVLYDYVSGTQYGMEVQEANIYNHLEDEDVSLQEAYSSGQMTYWLEQPHSRSNARIWFDPKPATGKIIRVMAIKYPEFKANDTDVFDLKQIFDRLLVLGPTMDLGNVGEGIPNRNFYERQYQLELEKARVILSQDSANYGRRVRYRETWQ